MRTANYSTVLCRPKAGAPPGRFDAGGHRPEPVPINAESLLRRLRRGASGPSPYPLPQALPDAHISARSRGIAYPQPPALAKAGVTPAPEPGSIHGSRCRRSRWRTGRTAEACPGPRSGLPREPRLDPGSGAGVTKGVRSPERPDWQARRIQAEIRCVHAVGLRGRGDAARAEPLFPNGLSAPQRDQR